MGNVSKIQQSNQIVENIPRSLQTIILQIDHHQYSQCQRSDLVDYGVMMKSFIPHSFCFVNSCIFFFLVIKCWPIARCRSNWLSLVNSFIQSGSKQTQVYRCVSFEFERITCWCQALWTVLRPVKGKYNVHRTNNQYCTIFTQYCNLTITLIYYIYHSLYQYVNDGAQGKIFGIKAQPMVKYW
jgi:hypothetical protein